MNPHLTPMQLPQDQGRPLLASRKSSSSVVVGEFFLDRGRTIDMTTIRDVTLLAIFESECFKHQDSNNYKKVKDGTVIITLLFLCTDQAGE